MAKRIIILGVGVQSDVFSHVDAVFWYPITQGALPTPNGSAWTGASTAETQAIQNGTVLEERNPFQFPVGMATATIEAVLLQYWTDRNAQINGRGPGVFSGTFNDSNTGWSQ